MVDRPPAESVHDLLRRRLSTKTREDQAQLAIVLEGGGMRGVLSASVAGVIEDMGLLELADIVVGTSAGATNATALAAGVIKDFTDSYAQIFASAEFIEPRRLLRGRPAIDSERIIERVESEFTIARAARRRSLRLAMVATDVNLAAPVALTDFESDDDVLRAVAASSRLPVLGGGPVEFRGTRWLDGGVSEAVPVSAARRLGATHAIVVTTRPITDAPGYSPADRAIERYLAYLNPDLAQHYSDRPARYRELMAYLARGKAHGVRTLTISPMPHDPIPSRMERDRSVLQRAAEVARSRAWEVLEDIVQAA